MVRVRLIGSPAEVNAIADALRTVAEVHGQSGQRPAQQSAGSIIVHLKARPAAGQAAAS